MAREARGLGTLLGCICVVLSGYGCSADEGSESPAAGGTGGAATGSGGATSGSGGSTTGSGGAPAPVSPGGLSGIWDAIGSRLGGRTESAIISIDSNRLEVLHDRYELIALRRDESFEATYREHGMGYWEPTIRTQDTLLVRTTPGSEHTGEFPINLFGQWVAGDDPLTPGGAPCQALLTASTLTGSCDDSGRLPGFLWHLREGQVTGQRTVALPSIFGDLGGVWELQASRRGSCTVRFEAQQIHVQCTGGSAYDGTLEVEFQGTLMSGRLSSGYEFSAQRR